MSTFRLFTPDPTVIWRLIIVMINMMIGDDDDDEEDFDMDHEKFTIWWSLDPMEYKIKIVQKVSTYTQTIVSQQS